MMSHGFDNTWGIVKDSGLASSAFHFFLYFFVQVSNVICFFLSQLAFTLI